MSQAGERAEAKVPAQVELANLNISREASMEGGQGLGEASARLAQCLLHVVCICLSPAEAKPTLVLMKIL